MNPLEILSGRIIVRAIVLEDNIGNEQVQEEPGHMACQPKARLVMKS